MPADCVFCDRTKFEERLIGQTNGFRIIATLGQITDGGYVLLVPKRHAPCIGAMEDMEMENLRRAITDLNLSFFAGYGFVPGLLFEHGIVGQTVKHAHLHFVPKACAVGEKIKNDFPESEIINIQSWTELRSLYEKLREPYLLWGDYKGTYVCWNPPAYPQYLRIAVAEALGRPERANWRSMDQELDKKLWSETVKRLKPYFS